MKQIFKICLISAIFFSCVSVAWASLNYNSINNFFLIDSILKTGGNYILIGEALSGYCNNPQFLTQSQCQINNSTWIEELKKADNTNSKEFFSISNNLIFLGSASAFTSGNRQIRDNFFSTNAITINNEVNDLEILTNGLPLIIKFNNSTLKKVQMNQDFIINNGLSVAAGERLSEIRTQTILADKLFTNEIALLSPDITSLVFDRSRVLNVTQKTGNNFVNSLTVGSTTQTGQPGPDMDFCQKVNWNATDDVVNYVDQHFPNMDTAINPTTSCTGVGEDLATSSSAQLTCCPRNYYVFKIDVMAGKMVCCRTGTYFDYH